MNQSQRSNPKVKPKFPRLQFLRKKRENNLEFYADEEFVLHVVPNQKSVSVRK